MKKILISSTNKEVIDIVKKGTNNYSEYFDPIYCPDTDEALSLIDYELPEIKVLDYTSKDIDTNRILAAIHSDPWLHNGGIIAVVPNPAIMQEIEDKKDPNIIIVLTLYSFRENFEILLRILWQNQQFVFNRGIQDRMGGQEKGNFICDNDPLDIRLYTSFLVNYLYCSNRIDDNGRYALQTALMELLTNALEHGNCNISYDEKTKWLESGNDILELIDQKRNLPENKNKKIQIKYFIGKDKSYFSIQDEGKGFDWRNRIKKNQEPNLEEEHGRGITLSKGLVPALKYNEKGNAVSFEINNLKDASNNVPGIMVPFATIEYHRHDIV